MWNFTPAIPAQGKLGRRVTPVIPAQGKQGRRVTPVIPDQGKLGRRVTPAISAQGKHGRRVTPAIPAQGKQGRKIAMNSRLAYLGNRKRPSCHNGNRTRGEAGVEVAKTERPMMTDNHEALDRKVSGSQHIREGWGKE